MDPARSFLPFFKKPQLLRWTGELSSCPNAVMTVYYSFRLQQNLHLQLVTTHNAKIHAALEDLLCFTTVFILLFSAVLTFLSVHLISYPSVCCFASTIFCFMFYYVLFQRQDSGLTVLSFHNRIRNQLHSALQLVQQWKKPSFSVTPCSHISTHSSITHTSVDTRSPHHCSFSKINTWLQTLIVCALNS